MLPFSTSARHFGKQFAKKRFSKSKMRGLWGAGFMGHMLRVQKHLTTEWQLLLLAPSLWLHLAVKSESRATKAKAV